MNTKPRAYVAGPMRGRPAFNFPAFDEATAYLRAMGWEVFNPAEHDRESGFNTEGMTGNEDLAAQGFDLRAALAADLAYITEKADAVAVLPGWEQSSGARAEVATAHALGLTVAPWEDFDADGHIDCLFHIKSATPPSGSLKTGAGSFGVSRAKAGKPEPVLTREQWEAVSLPRKGIDLDKGGPVYPLRSQLDITPKGEVRTTSSTGGQKGVKPEMFSLLPVEALEQVARHYGIGAAKYDRNQWRQGYEWSKSFDALQRHAMAFWRGEDTDHETQSPHMAAVAFHALTLLTFMDEHPSHDDRYRSNP